MISSITLFIDKDVSIEKFSKLYNVLWPLEVNVSPRIGCMLLAENSYRNQNIMIKGYNKNILCKLQTSIHLYNNLHYRHSVNLKKTV